METIESYLWDETGTKLIKTKAIREATKGCKSGEYCKVRGFALLYIPETDQRTIQQNFGCS